MGEADSKEHVGSVSSTSSWRKRHCAKRVAPSSGYWFPASSVTVLLSSISRPRLDIPSSFVHDSLIWSGRAACTESAPLAIVNTLQPARTKPAGAPRKRATPASASRSLLQCAFSPRAACGADAPPRGRRRDVDAVPDRVGEALLFSAQSGLAQMYSMRPCISSASLTRASRSSFRTISPIGRPCGAYAMPGWLCS